MDIALAIVAAAVVALVVFLLVRSKRPTELPSELPSERPEAKPAPPKEPARRAPEAEPEKAAPPAKPAPEVVPEAAPAAKAPAEAEAPKLSPEEEEARRRDVEAIRKGLATTRGGFIARLAKLFGGGRKIDAALFEEIEEVLLSADVGVQTSRRILDELRARLERGGLDDEESVWRCLRDQAVEILDVKAKPITLAHTPSLILVVGVNGVGKTTTIGKLASMYASAGKKVLLAAGDTYRAAAVLQLEVWGKRVQCPVVKGKDNADPGSVIFDAVRRARDEHFDLVIADTAGRLHTKVPLMEELKKLERTCQKALDGRGPDEILLVLDSTTGQNAVQQTQLFREALGVSGIVLTKLDGTAKGGVILGIVHQHGIPVRFIGLGERVEDLRVFESSAFVQALFAKPDGETLAA